jgi:hypothetical protein
MHAHEWAVVAEFDAGYVIGRCAHCGEQELLDVGALLPAPRPVPVAAEQVLHEVQ